jgi:hypothetical protein
LRHFTAFGLPSGFIGRSFVKTEALPEYLQILTFERYCPIEPHQAQSRECHDTERSNANPVTGSCLAPGLPDPKAARVTTQQSAVVTRAANPLTARVWD